METAIPPVAGQAQRPSLWTNRTFLAIWLGSAISVLGDGLYNLALMWWVYNVSKSAAITSLVFILGQLPRIVLGPVSGVFVDRLDRRRVMIATDLIRGLIVLLPAIKAIQGDLQLWHVLVTAGVLSAADAFFRPAFGASLPNIVVREHLTKANSLLSVTTNLGFFLGPAVGGLALGFLGTGGTMLINALSFFISALAILLGPFSSPRNDNGQAGSVLSEMLDGFQFLRARKTVLGILALASVMNFFAVPLGVLMPVIAVEVLRVDSRGFGLLQGIVSVGMMLGGLALAMLGETRKKGWALIGGLILSGFLMSTLGWSRSFWPSLAILGFLGMVVAGVNITLAVIMQNVVPDDKRGRVFAAMATVTGGLQPIAMALAGVAADAFSASVVLIAAGVAVFASSFGAFLVPGLRELE